MKTCTKVRYRDRVAALVALSETQRKRRARAADETRVYRCPDCRGWHLTSREVKPRSEPNAGK